MKKSILALGILLLTTNAAIHATNPVDIGSRRELFVDDLLIGELNGTQFRGTWPKSWPEELEPLRKQSRSLRGSLLDLTFYEIPFTNQKDFESAWPYILKVKSKAAPITLLRGAHKYLGTLKAGVRIWHPPYQTRNIWLVVDGDVVDLNRIRLPADTPIIDERFKDGLNE